MPTAVCFIVRIGRRYAAVQYRAYHFTTPEYTATASKEAARRTRATWFVVRRDTDAEAVRALAEQGIETFDSIRALKEAELATANPLNVRFTRRPDLDLEKAP